MISVWGIDEKGYEVRKAPEGNVNIEQAIKFLRDIEIENATA